MSKVNNVYEIVVRSPDRIKFIEGVCEWAAKGAVFTGETPRLNRIPYSARFKYYTTKRIKDGRFGNYVVLEDFLVRDKKELEELPIWQIQKMATKYGLTGRDKAQLIRAYLQAQDEYVKERGLVVEAETKAEPKVKPKNKPEPKPEAAEAPVAEDGIEEVSAETSAKAPAESEEVVKEEG